MGDRGGELSCPGVLPPRASSSGALGCAEAGDVCGRGVGGDAAETADGYGLQLSGADQRVARGPADAESAGGLFDLEEYEGRVVVAGGGEGAVFVQGFTPVGKGSREVAPQKPRNTQKPWIAALTCTDVGRCWLPQKSTKVPQK
jgi:hypothetical protein